MSEVARPSDRTTEPALPNGRLPDTLPAASHEAIDSRDRVCLLTNDVETHSIWFNRLQDATGERVLREGMPLLLNLYEKHTIRSTFFFTGHIARSFPEVVRMVLPFGHEVACHGLSHELDQAFDVLSPEDQLAHLCEAKQVLEDISGVPVVSFRAPALRVNEHTPKALIQAGFRIDSSVASQRFDMFMSFGGMNKLKWFTAPRLPYYTRTDALNRKGNGPLIEVPLSAMLYPYVGTTLRITPTLARILRTLLHHEERLHRKPIVFDIHPNEFIEEGSGRRTIARRARGLLSYLVQDYLRGRLKARNLGREAIRLYENEIRFFISHGYKFLTLTEYTRQFPPAR